MTNISSSQDVNNMRRYVIAVLVLALLAYGGMSIYHHMARSHHETATVAPPGVTPPKWKGGATVLHAAMQSSQYRNSGSDLSDPNTLNNASKTQRDAYSYRLLIDFLQSLTPDQNKALNNERGLSYTALTPDQQQALLRLGASRNEGVEPTNVKKTYIAVSTQSLDGQKYAFTWVEPLTDHSCGFNVDVYYSLNGTAEFMF